MRIRPARPVQRRQPLALTALLAGGLAASLAASLAGCGYGPIADPPCVRTPGTAATVTVKRLTTLVGAPATMFLVVEDERIYGLRLGESVTFQMDAGEHRIGYDLGFVRCRDRLFLEPGHQYRIELLPVCDIEPEDLSAVCPTPRTWPAPVRAPAPTTAPFVP